MSKCHDVHLCFHIGRTFDLARSTLIPIQVKHNSDTILSSTWLILAEILETLDTMDEVWDKDKDTIDMIKRGVGLLEGEEMD